MTHALLSSPPALALLPDAALVLHAQGQVVSASPPSAAMFGVDPTGPRVRHPRCRLRAIPIGMALFNTDGEYVRVNDALCRFLGAPRRRPARPPRPGAHPPGRPPEPTSTPPGASSRRARHVAVREALRAARRRLVWTLANLTFLRDEDGRPLCWVGQFQDITEPPRRRLRLAERDPLTELLNRRAFDRRAHTCAAARDAARGVLPIDLDGFKDINDAHGHPAGDACARTADHPGAAAPGRRLGPARRRRVRRPAAALQRRAGHAGGDDLAGVIAAQRVLRGARACGHRERGRRPGVAPRRAAPRPTARCTRPRPSAAGACAALTKDTSGDLGMPQFAA